MAQEEGFFSVKEFGAMGDGQTDDTAAIQAAIDAASGDGGNVLLPPGRYAVSGSLHIAPGVTVMGVHDAPVGFTAPTATVLLVTGGRDDEDAPALFEMGDSSMLRALTLWWPDQTPDDVHPYPWAVHMFGNDNTVENLTFINAYNGIRVGPETNCRHRIRSCYGCLLRRGVFVDNTWEIGRIENCQFHPHWWSQPEFGGDWKKVSAYMAEHLETFIFGRTDWEYVTNNFIFSCKIGYQFIHTEHGEFNGHMTGCGADGSGTAIWVERLQKMGLLIAGGEFVSLSGADPVQVRVRPGCDQGSVRFTNSAFWGLSNHVAVLEGDAYVSFSDCYFTNWKKDVPDKPILLAAKGRFQVNNSTFDTPHPSVHIGPEIRHAIIRGNNGITGVRIQDESQGKSIIADNEPPSAVDDPFAHEPR
ncbi:MAG: hypothetical protein GWP08_00790 [Nitrospiraceae bacterium]|nr:hypothetical protein [Nitrospiraceae bacterium]